jgi:hypothetical protein
MPATPAGFAPPAVPAGFAPPPSVPAPPAGPTQHLPPDGLSREYSQWARKQRPHGNVYGAGPGALGYETPESTDSLTGHILAQGRPDTDGSGNTLRVAMIMLIMLAAVVVVTVIAIS